MDIVGSIARYISGLPISSSGHGSHENDFHGLFAACDSGNVETVKSLVEKYKSETVSQFINQWDENTGETPLFRAAMRGHREIVLLLLQHQTNPDLVNQPRFRKKYGKWSALMITSSNGDAEMAKILLDHGADVKLRTSLYDDEGMSALMIAVQHGHHETVKLLLERGADANESFRYCEYRHSRWLDWAEDEVVSVLTLACNKGYAKIARMLLEFGAQNVNAALIIACKKGDTETARLLLESAGVKVDSTKEDELSSTEKTLIANIKIQMEPALIAASKGGHTETAILLLEHGAEVNKLDDCGTSALLTAARYGHAGIVKLLLKHGADVNFMPEYGQSALLLAVEHGHTETAKLLLEYSADVSVLHKISVFLSVVRHGYTETAKLLLQLGTCTDVNVVDSDGTSALLAAVRNGHSETAKLLLEHGADVDVLYRTSMILDVVRYGHTETAELLLELGTDVNFLDNDGTSVLLIAIQRRHTKIARLLLEHGADVNVVEKIYGASGLILAIQEGCTDIAKLLIEFGAAASIDVQDGTGWTALMYASKKGYTMIVEILLNHKPNLNVQASDGSSALYLAIVFHHTEICKLLLKNGASLKLKYSERPYQSVLSYMFPNADLQFGILEYSKGQSALMVACATNGPQTNEIVKLLLDYGDDINMLDIKGWSALAIVCNRGNAERVKLLLEHGASVNLQHTGLNGWSALLFASGGHTSTTKVLLEYGADVNMQDNDGWSALMLTSQDGYTETAEVLLEHQASVNQQKNDGWSALMIASYNGETEMIKLLVKYNAAINLLEDEGWSALMIACKKSHVETVKQLLGYEADVNILNNSGWSALMIASYIGCQKICELLLKFGAYISIENEYGWSALRAASYERHYGISKLLKESGAMLGYKGVENLNAEMILIVTNSEQHFSWDQFGLNIYVPQDSLPEEVKQCTIHIEVNTIGNHQLPQNTYLVSPVYSIKCIPKCQFSNSLILDIQHCAKQDNIHKLCFIRSTSANGRFDIIDNKVDHVDDSFFPRHCSYGYIELDRFCKYAAAQTQTEGDVFERIYRANIFYEKENARRYTVHFVILWDTSAHNKMVCDYYEKRNAKLKLDQTIKFKEKEIRLDIPFPCPTGVTFKSNRWKILSLNPPVIKKVEVDAFYSSEDERRIPSCQLLVKCEGKLTDLDHIVTLKGARKPDNAFMISISADKTVTKKHHGQIAKGTLVHSGMNFTALLRELSDAVSADWDDIGLLLQLDQGSLEVIKSNHPSNTSKCFREMIKLWLKQVNPPPSWSAIIEAIEIIKHKQLAERLRKKFL